MSLQIQVKCADQLYKTLLEGKKPDLKSIAPDLIPKIVAFYLKQNPGNNSDDPSWIQYRQIVELGLNKLGSYHGDTKNRLFSLVRQSNRFRQPLVRNALIRQVNQLIGSRANLVCFFDALKEVKWEIKDCALPFLVPFTQSNVHFYSQALRTTFLSRLARFSQNRKLLRDVVKVEELALFFFMCQKMLSSRGSTERGTNLLTVALNPIDLKDEGSNMVLTAIRSLKALYYFERDRQFNNEFIRIISSLYLERVVTSLNHSIGVNEDKCRDKNACVTYYGHLFHEKLYTHLYLFGELLQATKEGRDAKWRIDNSPEIQYLETTYPGFARAFSSTGNPRYFRYENQPYTISIASSTIDRVLLGTETPSCLSVYGGHDIKSALLGYMTDAAVLPIIIQKNKPNSPIEARCIVTIWHTQKSHVIFLVEPIVYHRQTQNDYFEEIISKYIDVYSQQLENQFRHNIDGRLKVYVVQNQRDGNYKLNIYNQGRNTPEILHDTFNCVFKDARHPHKKQINLDVPF